MRPGGGHAKGAGFERRICRALSSWLTAGARDDLFSRNVLSGGQFTVAKGKRGSPGDITGVDPLAAPFLALFAVECKHHRSLYLEQLLLKPLGDSPFGRIIEDTRHQARLAGKSYLVIAQQNRCEALVVMDRAIAACILYKPRSFQYHLLHNERIMLMPLASFMRADPAKFLDAVRNRHLHRQP
jgi:hypothetical protein